ncbi:hypothetical protein MPH_10119, partial [Macrophomina phaseolina MS6]
MRLSKKVLLAVLATLLRRASTAPTSPQDYHVFREAGAHVASLFPRQLSSNILGSVCPCAQSIILQLPDAIQRQLNDALASLLAANALILPSSATAPLQSGAAGSSTSDASSSAILGGLATSPIASAGPPSSALESIVSELPSDAASALLPMLSTVTPPASALPASQSNVEPSLLSNIVPALEPSVLASPLSSDDASTVSSLTPSAPPSAAGPLDSSIDPLVSSIAALPASQIPSALSALPSSALGPVLSELPSSVLLNSPSGPESALSPAPTGSQFTSTFVPLPSLAPAATSRTYPSPVVNLAFQLGISLDGLPDDIISALNAIANLVPLPPGSTMPPGSAFGPQLPSSSGVVTGGVIPTPLSSAADAIQSLLESLQSNAASVLTPPPTDLALLSGVATLPPQVVSVVAEAGPVISGLSSVLAAPTAPTGALASALTQLPPALASALSELPPDVASAVSQVDGIASVLAGLPPVYSPAASDVPSNVASAVSEVGSAISAIPTDEPASVLSELPPNVASVASQGDSAAAPWPSALPAPSSSFASADAASGLPPSANPLSSAPINEPTPEPLSATAPLNNAGDIASALPPSSPDAPSTLPEAPANSQPVASTFAAAPSSVPPVAIPQPSNVASDLAAPITESAPISSGSPQSSPSVISGIGNVASDFVPQPSSFTSSSAISVSPFAGAPTNAAAPSDGQSNPPTAASPIAQPQLSDIATSSALNVVQGNSNLAGVATTAVPQAVSQSHSDL